MYIQAVLIYFPSSLDKNNEKTKMCKFDSDIEIQNFVKMCFLPVAILRFLASVYFKNLIWNAENIDSVIFDTGFFSMQHIHTLIRAVYQGMYFTIIFKNVWVHKDSFFENCIIDH